MYTKCLIVAGICLVLIAGPGQNRSRAAGRESLTAAGRKIVRELQRRDFVAFNDEVCSQGLLIVRRESDWNRSNVPLKDKPAKPGYLSFQGMKTVAWKECEISFAKPDLRNPVYLSLLTQFRQLVL